MGATVDDAASRISSMLNPEPTEPTGEQETGKQSTEETLTSDTPSGEELYTVKVNGEELQVSLDELKKGHMRERDYRHKSMEVSNLRKETEAKLQALDKKIEDATMLAEFDLKYLESEEGQQLKQTEPELYLQKLDDLKSRSEKIKAFKEDKAQREAEQLKESYQKEQEALAQKIPDWLDPDIKKSELNDMFNVLLEQGYTEDELNRMTDHRVFVLARDSMKLKSLLNKDLSDKEVKTPPKSVAPGSTEKKPRKTKQQTLQENLKKSGSMQDAAALIKSRIFK